MKSIYYLFFSSLFIFQAVFGQNNQTQEEVEKRSVQQYESGRVQKNVRFMPAPDEHETLFGAHLVRTSTLLATSCKDYSHSVKVLIYGPSIVGSSVFTEELETQIKSKFPYADITVENKAIGGFGLDRLVRTAWHDVYPAYPDLIVFHAYIGANHSEIERILSNIRRQTTAEIILMNHHLDADRATLYDHDFAYIRYLANKYDCEPVDISTGWLKYLADYNLDKNELLRDHVHQNRDGSWLMAHLIVRHLRYNPLFIGNWNQTVQTFFTAGAYDQGGIANPFSFSNERWAIVKGIPIGDSPKNTLKFTFFGNRIDMIAGFSDSTKLGSARIKIDNRPVSEIPGLYAVTRPSKGAGGWWPAIMRIDNSKPLIPETWTLRMDQVNADSTVYQFSVKGSKTGLDGSGNTAEPFTSKSGRVVIEPSDFMFKEVKQTFKTPTPVGFEIEWTVYPLFQEVYQSPVVKDRSKVYKTTLAQGLTNDYHTIEIIPVGDGEVPIEAFEVHRPPMK